MTGSHILSRGITLVVAAFLAVALVVPAVADANAQRVEQLRSELNRINDEFTRAGATYDKAYWALDETEKAIDDTTARIGENETSLAEAQDALQERMAAWYRTDNLGFIEFLLGAQDFNDLATRLDYASRIAQDDASAIKRVRELLAELNADRERLEIEQAERATKVDAFKAERDSLQKRLQSKRSEYERVQRELAEEARKAEEARRRAVSATAAPVAARPAAAAVASANGMVFPVAGANYYSDTWGASRGGGRRSHKGTDIMAATGTPVVATLSGTVSRGNGATSGLYVRLKADNGWTFYYMHLNSIIVGSGRVTAGQTIGTVGYSGNASASAPHLHYEIHPAGRAVNPYPYLRQMQGR